MRGLALALVLAACGTHSPPPAQRISVGNAAPDAGVAQTSATCGQGACTSGATCAYAGGSCYCGVPSWCGGVAPPEDYYQQPPSWQCTADPPAVRADGCPGTEPSGACAREGQSCSYGDCCFTQLTCQQGQWQMTGGGCPP